MTPCTGPALGFDSVSSDLVCCFFCDISNCLFKPLAVSLAVPGPVVLVVLLVRMTL